MLSKVAGELGQWKKSLYMYVDQLNRSRVNPKGEQKRTVLARPELLLDQGERSRRLADWYAGRGITPLRGETGVKVRNVARETATEAVADIALHSAFYYEKGGITHREDIVETERLTFVREGTGWKVAAVERRIAERSAAAGGRGGRDAADERPRSKQPAAPLLNRRVLGAPESPRRVRYRREAAAAYADRWWQEGNPEFETFEVDCTNYISQCLFAGGAPIHYTGRRETGWWYKGYEEGREWWSFSWAVSDSLQRYLGAERKAGLRAEEVYRPEQLMLGDVIFYDWDGNGRYQHSTIVTAFDAGGMPLVNAHTVSSRHRYWDYKDSYAWTERTSYRFFHISDYL